MDITRLAISQVTTRKWDFGEDVIGYLSAGIHAMGVWRDKLDLFGEEAGIHLVRERSMKVSSISDAGFFLSKTRSQTALAIQDVLTAIDLAKKMEADSLVVITGEGGSLFRSVDLDRQMVMAAIREIAPYAESHGVKLAIEAVNGKRYPGNTFLHSIPDVLNFIDRISSPAIGLCFDVDHLWEEQDLFEHIRQASGRIMAVHLTDMPAEPKPPFDRRLPGSGIVPLSEILNAIVDSGYSGYFDLEIFSEDLWARDYPELLKESLQVFERI